MPSSTSSATVHHSQSLSATGIISAQLAGIIIIIIIISYDVTK